MSVLILVEHDNQRINPSIRSLLTAASQFNETINLLVAGYQCDAVAEEASKLPGVSLVWVADDACFEHPIAENISALAVELSGPCQVIMAASSTFGKNCLPRIAALLDVTQVTDVTKIIEKDTFEHPIYAGNAIETLRVLDEKKIMSIRTTAFSAAVGTQEPACIERVKHTISPSSTHFVQRMVEAMQRPDLSGAKVVVSGGRGLQSAEQFQLIYDLADILGAAVGASRAAVDAGFVANEYQVGQTGKVVAPEVYFAVGISGAIQHLAGIKDSKKIIAINKDPNAPIFQVADYGLVGDLFQLVPQLIEKIKVKGF